MYHAGRMCEGSVSLSALWDFVIATAIDTYVLVAAVRRPAFAIVSVTAYLSGNWYWSISCLSGGRGRVTYVVGIASAVWGRWERERHIACMRGSCGEMCLAYRQLIGPSRVWGFAVMGRSLLWAWDVWVSKASWSDEFAINMSPLAWVVYTLSWGNSFPVKLKMIRLDSIPCVLFQEIV